MIKLALPGLVMILAEWLTFEILNLAASYLSTAHLAAQTLLSTVCTLVFHLPFPMSIAASIRIANLIGASQIQEARTAALVAIVISSAVGLFNFTILFIFQSNIPKLFTSDPGVIWLATSTLSVCTILQLVDSPATICNGILRGLGRQNVGGYINLFAFYIVALPVSLISCFWFQLGLHGLWIGPTLALLL
jgi:multidrug resistance protein, MATE family